MPTKSHHAKSKAKKPKVNKRRLTMLVTIVVVVGFIGGVMILASRAGTYLVSVEAENGVLGSTAKRNTIAGASGDNQAITFASNSTAVSCDQAGIQKLVDSVSQAKVESTMQELVQDDSKPTPNELISRHVSSPGNQIKVDWAKQQYTSYGLQIIDQPFTSGGRKLNNVVARLAGTDTDSFYTIGGHIDAINGGDDGENQSGKAAPGADDDGTGVIAAMEAARVLKGFQPCMKASIDFNGYNDEEEGENGSPTYFKSMSGKTIKGAYNMDMVAWAPTKECLKSDYQKSARDSVMTKKIIDMNTKYNVGLDVSSSAYPQDGDDDMGAFWRANVPGGYLIECAGEKDSAAYPDYHSPNDKTENVNMSQLTKVAKLLVAALAEFSMQ